MSNNSKKTGLQRYKIKMKRQFIKLELRHMNYDTASAGSTGKCKISGLFTGGGDPLPLGFLRRRSWREVNSLSKFCTSIWNLQIYPD